MIRFEVYGIPAPKGSKTPTRWGGFREASKKLPAWRTAVRKAAEAYIEAHPEQQFPISEPFDLHLTLFLPRPKSVRRILPSVKPDRDKLERAVMDELTQSGMIVDDCLSTDGRIRKRYADTREPGASIEIRPVTSDYDEFITAKNCCLDCF